MESSSPALRAVGFILGLALVGAHAVALWRGPLVRRWLAALPRSRPAGLVLLTLVLVWTFWLAWSMDYGEFSNLRTTVLVGLPVIYVLTLTFLDEFLAARALGILLLLAAAPVLDAAYLKPPTSRLLVVILAYVWVVLGVIWVWSPYLLRDQLEWLRRSLPRWRVASVAGLVYGLLVLFCALTRY